MVNFNGYAFDYGEYVYLKGIYDTHDKAVIAATKLIEKLKESCGYGPDTEPDDLITKIELNKSYPTIDGGLGLSTEICLGGYAE
jgi:hypothetical protein